MLCEILFNFHYSFSKFIAIPFLLVFWIGSYFRYRRGKVIKQMLALWKTEEFIDKKRNGFLIIILFTITILFPIIIGILRHNYGFNI